MIYQDDLIYLTETKDLKGHKIRIMAVPLIHSPDPNFEERTLCYIKLYEYMRKTSVRVEEFNRGRVTVAKVIKSKFFIVDNTHCSIRGHWHLMACDDLDSEDPLLSDTPKVKFPLKKTSQRGFRGKPRTHNKNGRIRKKRSDAGVPQVKFP